jgi:hypothetical protein
MKRSIALLPLLFLFMIAGTASAQNKTTYTAVFNYDQAALNKAVESKAVEFTVNSVNSAQAKEMEKTAKFYVTSFDTKLEPANGNMVCKVSLKQDNQMKILYRFFVSNNIKDVVFNGEKISAESFFKQWM